MLRSAFVLVVALLIANLSPASEDKGLAGMELNGLLSRGGDTMAAFFDPSSNRSFWLEQGSERFGIRLVEVNPQEGWAIASNGRDARKILLSRPEIVDPLTMLRMRTPSGFGGLSEQEKIEEEKRADRVEMDLLVSFSLDQERRREAAERRRRAVVRTP